MSRYKPILLRPVKIILRRMFNLDVFEHRPNHHYVPDYYGTAAQKLIDISKIPEFSGLAGKVIKDRRTFLYYDRLYTLYQSLLNLMRLQDMLHADMAEVGVYKGGSSYFIASLILKFGYESICLHCFDTFEGHSSKDIMGVKDPYQKPGFFNDTGFEDVKQYLSEFTQVKIYKGRFQDTSSQVEKQKFSFVHLDVDLYDPTAYALQFFNSRMILGGIIIVDDYGFVTCPGVKQAVDEFIAGKQNYSVLNLLTGQCVLIKR